ncbi:helix-turn-helix domain-containing protein [Pseudomonas soli]|uniref:Helix-turn-helix domain-containing protein n=1 Tax=Pseudomonas soli TaxID=1306993 RepID=A0ABU7GVX2_9PSED|nr:helix-turn-helix domain-containing protein [Pseudomonas soli]MEE1883176.1 helix-turn-helix domain-containing protein [Pseudomonas soli]
MDKKSAAAVLDRLHTVFGVKNDSQLCEVTGVNRPTMGNWRSRNSVPYPLCVSVAEEKGVSLDWLITGEGVMDRSHRTNEDDALLDDPLERSILTLCRSLDEEAKRDIQSVAQEKKRLSDIEKQLTKLMLALADIKRPA